jgi:beta-glucosidase
MVMSSFNVFNDIPVTVNKYLLRDVLRDELGFKGVVISDYTSSGEVMHHKCALDEREVAKKSIIAGLDHEMISPNRVFMNAIISLII